MGFINKMNDACFSSCTTGNCFNYNEFNETCCRLRHFMKTWAFLCISVIIVGIPHEATARNDQKQYGRNVQRNHSRKQLDHRHAKVVKLFLWLEARADFGQELLQALCRIVLHVEDDRREKRGEKDTEKEDVGTFPEFGAKANSLESKRKRGCSRLTLCSL